MPYDLSVTTKTKREAEKQALKWRGQGFNTVINKVHDGYLVRRSSGTAKKRKKSKI